MGHADKCGHCHEIEQRRITAAKRELAEKVLAAIERVNPHLDGPAMRQVITEQVQHVFTEPGVAVEKEG